MATRETAAEKAQISDIDRAVASGARNELVDVDPGVDAVLADVMDDETLQMFTRMDAVARDIVSALSPGPVILFINNLETRQLWPCLQRLGTRQPVGPLSSNAGRQLAVMDETLPSVHTDGRRGARLCECWPLQCSMAPACKAD